MTRLAIALLCFSIIFSASTAAATPLKAYRTARDRYIAALKPPHDGDNALHDKALAEMKARLKVILPAWSAPGFPKTPGLNRDTLVDSDIGFAQLDGFRYTAKDKRVVVSSLPLLREWMAGRKEGGVPLDKLIRSEDFYTFAISNDAGAVLYGEVPVQSGARKAVVLLGAFAQEQIFDQGPSELIAAVIDGEKVFIADENLSPALKPIPVCQTAMKKKLAEAASAFAAYRASKEKDQAQFDKNLRLENEADKGYRACFAREIQKQSAWPAIQKQAQQLLERLK